MVYHSVALVYQWCSCISMVYQWYTNGIPMVCHSIPSVY